MIDVDNMAICSTCGLKIVYDGNIIELMKIIKQAELEHDEECGSVATFIVNDMKCLVYTCVCNWYDIIAKVIT